jgi:hypothetical protein
LFREWEIETEGFLNKKKIFSKCLKVTLIVSLLILLVLVVAAIVIGLMFTPKTPIVEFWRSTTEDFFINYSITDPSESYAELELMIYINITNDNIIGVTLESLLFDVFWEDGEDDVWLGIAERGDVKVKAREVTVGSTDLN